MKNQVWCPVCGGDGMETCNNPDHGFLEGIVSQTGTHSAGESACPVCGHSTDHKTGKKCPECNGTGIMEFNQAMEISEQYGLDNELIPVKMDNLKLSN